MKKHLLFLLLAMSLPMCAQTTKTVNYTIQPGLCQTSSVSQNCAGYMTSPNAAEPMYEEEWSLYANPIQPDGSFNAGFLNLYAAFDDDVVNTAEDVTSFTTSSISGTVVNGFINGTATGTLSGKHTGTFTESFVNLKIGTGRRCAGRYGCHTVPAIVSGSINVTAQVNQ